MSFALKLLTLQIDLNMVINSHSFHQGPNVTVKVWREALKPQELDTDLILFHGI